MAILKTCLAPRLLRYLILPTRSIRISTVINSQTNSSEVVEEMDKIQGNPYYGKYADKIAKLQKTSPDELVKRLEGAQKMQEKPKVVAANPSAEAERDYSELLNPKKTLKDVKADGAQKKLSDIMKLELVQDKSVEEITSIWLEYHKSKEVLVATVPVEKYDLLMKRGKDFPIFIFPLPRSQGYEFFMTQFDKNNCIHFTSLLCYQVHKENAPECLNMVHYTELRDKGVVLMRGEYDPKVINAKEAQCLANQFQLYYAQNDATKLKLVEAFTKTPESFKHMDVIKELENLKID